MAQAAVGEGARAGDARDGGGGGGDGDGGDGGGSLRHFRRRKFCGTDGDGGDGEGGAARGVESWVCSWW